MKRQKAEPLAFSSRLCQKRGWLIKGKTAQFYLIAAIIISVVILGLVTMSNYSRRQESIRTENIGEELNIESEKVLDFGTYNGYSESQMQDLMENFSGNYINYVQEGVDFYFLFGKQQQDNSCWIFPVRFNNIC